MILLAVSYGFCPQHFGVGSFSTTRITVSAPAVDARHYELDRSIGPCSFIRLPSTPRPIPSTGSLLRPSHNERLDFESRVFL